MSLSLEVEQGKLARALGVVSRVAGGGGVGTPMLPILSNVLLRVKEGRLSLTATNLDMAVVEYVVPTEMVEGEVTVPAKLLADFVGNLPKQETVKIVADGVKIKISAGKYSSVLNGIDSEDFPELPEINEEAAVIFRVGAEEFKAAVGEVIVACSNNTTRPILTGVYFNTHEGKLYLAATDGYRLAEKMFISGVQSEVKAVVPAVSLMEVLRSLNDGVEEVEVLFDETQVRFRLGEIEITSKLLDGSYVDYRGLIPKESDVKVVVERSELVRVVKLAALFARASGGAIVCEADAERKILNVAAVANEFGENNSEIEAEVQTNAKVVFNSKFLLDALNVIAGEKVVFGFSDKVAPIVLSCENDDSYVHIVMPQHI